MSELKIEYLNSVKAELESRGWQPDRNGEPDCVDEASAAGADAISELITLRAECERLRSDYSKATAAIKDNYEYIERLRQGDARINNYIYYMAYHAGHHDTVEGNYTDVLFVDAFTYHDDVVSDLLAQLNQSNKG